MEEKSPEQLMAESQKLMAESQKLHSTANILSRASTLLMIGGCVIPCLIIVVLAMFSK